MKRITLMLLLIQSGFIMAQTETVVTPNGKKVQVNTNSVGTADNGLTKTAGNVQLGGALTKPTTLTTTSVNYLSIQGLETGTLTDQLLSTDINGVVRKIDISDLGKTTEGTNVTVTGTGTPTDPYIISSPFQTATEITSTAISATNSTAAVPSTNVQGAISDLAKELSQKWETQGNVETIAGTYFIGTTDDQDLVFKRFGTQSGRISLSNTSLGYGSLPATSTGSQNTAFGSNTLARNTTGKDNTAIGSNTTLSRNTIGDRNTAVGISAIMNNISGIANVALGEVALNNITSGNENISIGFNSGRYIGDGTNLTTNNKSLFIGSYTSALSNGSTNEIIIGGGGTGKGSNTVILGNSTTTSIGGYTAWSNYSDSRLKKNITSSPYGLDFITKLRPVLYNMKTGTTELQSGFIAQEVEAAANSIGYKFSGVVKPQSDNDFYSLSYGAFVVPLVKAVQEQQKQMEEEEARLLDIENRILKLEQKLK